MVRVDMGASSPAEVVRKVAGLQGEEILKRRRRAAQLVFREAVAEQETPQARAVVDTFARVREIATAQLLFDTVKESGLPQILYPRGYSLVESGGIRADVLPDWQQTVFSGIGQSYIEGKIHFGYGTTVITPDKTVEACQKVLPDMIDKLIPPDGLVIQEGRIIAGVVYDFSPERDPIVERLRHFRQYMDAFGELSIDHPKLFLVTPPLDRKTIAGISSLLPIFIPATAYELQAYANILFDVCPQEGGESLAEVLEFGRRVTVPTTR